MSVENCYTVLCIQDDRLWALKGHNFYKLELMSEAKEAFQFALNCPDIPDDAHLVNLR